MCDNEASSIEYRNGKEKAIDKKLSLETELYKVGTKNDKRMYMHICVMI